MSKQLLRIAVRTNALIIVLFLCAEQSTAATYINSNFTLIDTTGSTFSGTNDLIAEWDDSLNTEVSSTNFNMSMYSASDFPLWGFPPTYHHIRVFGAGSYSFDTTCSVEQLEAGTADCGGIPSDHVNLDIGNDQIGAHILMDWTNITYNEEYLNADIAVLWNINGIFDASSQLYQGLAGPTPALDTVYQLVSVDGDSDGVPGIRMIDGQFLGFSANFNLQEIPVPPALWLFGSGLLGLVGIARRKKSA